MGCYLSKPITDKVCENFDKENIRVGTCSMQGWRTSQEDAHNAIIDFTSELSLFGVYDGHGGAEVAEWISKKFPDILKKEIEEEKIDLNEAFGKRIQEIFVKTDEMITTDEVIKELFEIADKKVPEQVVDRDEIRGELDELNEEAEMTHEELLKKYNVNATEFNEQKEEIANIFLKELANMQQAEAEESSEDEEEKAEKKSLNERQARLKKELNDESNNGKTIEESNSEASSSDEDCDDPNDPDVENSSEMKKQLASLEDNEFCGRDSGCTCILALYQKVKKQVLAANIGDSRCVISRAGLAIDMSFDHKPEDDIELKRIIKAGGFLTDDGRVKGGLNLSRAFGDHMYKDNTKLELKDQMITAFPDIKYHNVTEEDEFMILACDGIWNVMTNQEAVDFVRDRLEKDTKISDILEEMFDHCLAPDTSGDGCGCDNMTGMIIQLNPRSKNSKRPRSDGDDDDQEVDDKVDQVESKKMKPSDDQKA